MADSSDKLNLSIVQTFDWVLDRLDELSPSGPGSLQHDALRRAARAAIGPSDASDANVDGQTARGETGVDAASLARAVTVWETRIAEECRRRLVPVESVWLRVGGLFGLNAEAKSHSSKPPSGARYDLKSIAGEGGQGLVWEAVDKTTSETVAIKFFNTPSATDDATFDSERKALLALGSPGHDHVVRIVPDEEFRWHKAVGEPAFPPEGCRYIVMEFVDGTLKTCIAAEKVGEPGRPYAFDQREAARVVRCVASAVVYAHGLRGVDDRREPILHRDIKPGNVLLADGVVKLTDFGLARRVADDFVTQTGAGKGTLDYMAPEQLTGEGVGPATDVYGLGAILYESLTGRCPFIKLRPQEKTNRVRVTVFTRWRLSGRRALHGVTFEDLIRRSRPPRPSTLRPGLDARLETICERCLCKDSASRPEAGEVVDALDAYLEDRAFPMRPLGLWSRAREWNWRNPLGPVGQSVLSIGIIVLIALLVVSNLAVALKSAKTELAGANGKLLVDQAAAKTANSDPAAALFLLTTALENSPTGAAAQQDHLRRAIAGSHNSLHALEAILEHPAKLRGAAMSPDGGSLALAGDDGTLAVYDATSWTPKDKRSFGGLKESVAAVAYSPDGKLILAATNDRKLHVLDAATLQNYRGRDAFELPLRPVTLAIRASANTVAVGGTPQGTGRDRSPLVVFDYENGKPIALPIRVPGQVYAVAYSPDGKLIATSGHEDNRLRVWSARGGAVVIDDGPAHPGPIFAIAFSPDSAQVITGCIDGGVRFWGARDGRPIGRPVRHSHPVRTLAVTGGPAGEYVLSGAADGTARVWDIGLRTPVGQPFVHLADVRGCTFSSDGRLAVTTGFDGAARVWRQRHNAEVTVLRHPAGVAAVAFCPDGRSVLTGCRDSESGKGEVRLWTDGGRLLQSFKTYGEALAVGTAGDLVLGAGNDGHARVWHKDDIDPLHALPHGPRKNTIYDAAISPDGTKVAFAGRGDDVNLLDRSAGLLIDRLLRSFPLPWDPWYSKEFRAWQTAFITTWSSAPRPLKHASDTEWVFSVAFSPDGRRLLSGGKNVARLWDVGTRVAVGGPMEHSTKTEVRWAGFSPDGRRVMTCCYDGSVGIWDGETGGKIRGLTGHQGRAYAGAFDPTNPNRVATAGADKTVRVWDLDAPEPEVTRIVHDSPVLAVAFDPDGRTIGSGCANGAVRIWSLESGAWEGATLFHQGLVNRVIFQRGPTGTDRLLTASGDGTARLWTLPEPAQGEPGLLRLQFEAESGMSPSPDRDRAGGALDPLRSREALLLVLEPGEWRKKKDELKKRMARR